MSFTLDQMSKEIPSRWPDFNEEVTEEGVRFAVAVILANVQETQEWTQDKALRERAREFMEAWLV